MNRVSLILLLAGLYVALLAGTAIAQSQLERDILKTSAGDLEITFIGHGTLIFGFGCKIIHVDPYGKLADYAKLPKADLILITHEHRDHLDLDALTPIRTEQTIVVLPEVCAAKVPGSTVMKHGDVRTVLGVELQAVPAYNLVPKRDSGEPFHVKGVGNGYVLTFGDKLIMAGAYIGLYNVIRSLYFHRGVAS